MATSGDSNGFVDRRPLWRRRVLRALAIFLSVLATGYLTLPWWLPTGWIGQRLCNQLSDGLGRKASVGRVTLSWSEGIQFEDLTIEAAPNQAFPHFVSVGKLTCGFTPLRTAWTGRVDRIEMMEPSVWLAFDDQGRLTNLQEIGESNQLPAFEFLLIDPACHLHMPEGNQVFGLKRVQCSIDPDKGLVEVEGSTHGDETSAEGILDSFSVQSRITVPQINRAVTFHGETRIAWNNLVLDALPGPLVSELPIKKMSGQTSGDLELITPASMKLQYELDVTLNGVSMAWKGEASESRIPDARITSRGQFNPATEELLLDDFEFESPGLRVARPEDLPGPTMLIDQIGVEPFQIHVEGRVKDFSQFMREFPTVATLLAQAGLEVEGQATFALSLDPSGTQDRLNLALDGSASSWIWREEDAKLMHLHEGVHKDLHAKVVLDRREGHVVLSHLKCNLDQTTVEFNSDVEWSVHAWNPISTESLLAAATVSPSRLSIHTSAIERVISDIPLFERWVDADQWSGGFALDLRAEPRNDPEGIPQDVTLAVELHADTQTSLHAGEYWLKPEGEVLLARLETVLPRAPFDRIELPLLEFSQGDFRLATTPGRIPVKFRLAPTTNAPTRQGGFEGDVEWTLPLTIASIEKAIQRSPLLARWLNRADLELSGNVNATFSGTASTSPDETYLRHRLELVADDLTLSMPEVVSRSRGRPLRIMAEHEHRRILRGTEQSVRVHLNHPAATIDAAMTESSAPAGSIAPLRTVIIDAEFDEITRLGEELPILAPLLKEYRVKGDAEVHLDWMSTPDEQFGRLACNADAAQFLIPGETPLLKPMDVSSRLTTSWTTRQMQPSVYTLEIHDGTFTLDDTQLDSIAGDLTLSLADENRSNVREMERTPAGIAQQWFAVKTPSGQIDVNARIGRMSALTDQHPELKQELDRWQAQGHLSTSCGLTFDPQRLTLTWDADASRLSWDTPLNLVWHRREAKSFGQPLDAIGTLELTRDTSGRVSYTLDDARLSMHGADFLASGQWTIASHGSDILIEDGEIDIGLSVEDLNTVLAPRSQLADTASGELIAQSLWSCRQGRWSADSGMITMNDVSLTKADVEFALDGALEWDDQRIQADQLAWQFGSSLGNLSADLARHPKGKPGYVGLACRRLDVPTLKEDWGKVRSALPERPSTLPAGENSSLVDGRPPWVPAFLAYVREHDLRLNAHMDALAVILPPNVHAEVDAVSAAADLTGGEFNFTFSALADGGDVRGEMVTDFNVDDPQYHLTYEAKRLEPGPLVNAYLRQSFPGMTAEGPLTIIDETYQKLFPRAEEANPQVGEGELIIEGGVLSGRSAPKWLTRIFPKLNLTHYDFDYLHSWFEKLSSGRIRHRMILQGKFYNIYMDGYSDPDQRMKYQVGIDLLADFDSKYWMETGQGRIPLFVKSGVAQPDGTLANERITYETSAKILDTIFIKNNPVVTAYHAVVRKAKEAE